MMQPQPIQSPAGFGTSTAKSSHCRDNPSFSSSLLDAIYRSIDESDDTATAEKQAAEPPVIRRKHEVASDIQYSRCHHRRPVLSTTTSSFDASGYSSLSSSNAEFSRSRPIRTTAPPPRRDVPPPSLPHHGGQDKKKSFSFWNRFRDIRKPKAESASLGSRLASFINTLFSSGPGNPKKAKISPPARVRSPSPCSSAMSYTRSCLGKTPPSGDRGGGGGKRTVWFGPVSVVAGGEDGLRRRSGDGGDAARESRRMVEELLRGLGAAEEEDDEDSDSSSDLFELEIVSSARGGRYRNELPV